MEGIFFLIPGEISSPTFCNPILKTGRQIMNHKKALYLLTLIIGLGISTALILNTPVEAAKIDGADQGGRPLTAVMTGANEAPGPGDPDGSGFAIVTLNQGQGQICFEITLENVDPITAAHIHSGPAGVPGPIVVNFNPAVNGLSGCVDVDPELIKAIRQNPSDYYVNVHNPAFPAGAVRGQLSK